MEIKFLFNPLSPIISMYVLLTFLHTRGMVSRENLITHQKNFFFGEHLPYSLELCFMTW